MELMKFKNIDLSLKQQDYVETIFTLSRVHKHAHTKTIADTLGIKMASVSEAVRGLAEKGIVKYRLRRNITLTALGREIAMELEKRHSALADFFRNILGCSEGQSEEIACKVEHVIDEEFRVRLSEFAYFLRHELASDGKDPLDAFRKRYNLQYSDDEE